MPPLRFTLAVFAVLPLFCSGADAADLVGLRASIQAGERQNIHGIVVRMGGRRIADWYFTGADEKRGNPLGVVTFNAGVVHDVRSVTKSLISVLFGIALRKGEIRDLDESVLNYFPEYAELRTPERIRIRLRDVLSMTSGLQWDERTFPYSDVRNDEIAMDNAPDRLRYILSRPLLSEPGTRFNYSGGDVALVAAVLARAARIPLDEFARQELFGPLGIRNYQWIRDPSGVVMAASGLRLQPTDMAKIGQLMLQNGRWGRRQILAPTWVKDATSIHAQVQPDQRCGIQYGYLWWLGALCEENGRTPFYFANGNGGQRIWVFDSLQLVIASTAGLYEADDRAVDDVALAIVHAQGNNRL